MQHSLAKSVGLKLVSLEMKAPEAKINRFIELTYLKTLLKLLNINLVLDVGANRGQTAHDLRGIGYTGYIISFEPVHQEFAALSLSFSRDTKWRGYQIALGSENKSAKINVDDVTVMSSLLKSIDEHRDIKTQDIDIKRLDSLFPSITENIITPRVFLKMDTQGYDLEVFEGARQCLGYIHGIQSELSVQPLYKNMPHYNEALSTYEKAGFELYNLSVVNRISTGGLLELNAFMRRSIESK